jgi:acyl-CoA reductase-like NAD-dependent aldehyde dehydrogenase
VNAASIPASNFIANAWRAPASGDVLPMIDPSDGTQFATIARGNAQDIDAAVSAAQAARDGITYAPRVDEQTLAYKFVPGKEAIGAAQSKPKT